MTKYKLQINKKNNSEFEGGQTLVLLLIFVMMIIAITTAATFIIANNSMAATNISIGNATRLMAESGIERAMLGVLRDPSYTGETFTIDTGTVYATVSGTTTLTIDSTAVNGNFTKKIEAIATYSGYALTLNSWKDK